MRQVGGDPCVLLRSPEAEQAEAGDERDARQRIERLLDAADARILAREIALVVLDERLHRRVRGALEVIRLAVLGRGDHQRPVLGADGVIGRDHACLAVAGKVGAADKIHDPGTGAEVEDQASPCTLDVRVLAAARAAQDRRNRGDRRDRLRQLRCHEHRLAIALQPLLGQRDERDHALVGVARAVAEREDAVLVQDQPFDVGLGVVDIGRHLRQREARHHVGNDAHPSVIEFGADGFAIRLVDQAQDGVGMRVVDKSVRQEGVQQGFDRRVRRRGLEQVFALNAHHVLVGEFGAGAQLAQASRRTAGSPAGSITAMSAPEPLTQSTATSSPSRSGIVVFTEVLPPPCSTSLGSRPSRRVV